MIVAGSASPLLLSSAGGYNLTNSLRFRSSASAYLNRTPASATNRTTWTWSAWVKRGDVASNDNRLFGAGTSNSDRVLIAIENYISLVGTNSGSNVLVLQTTPVYRDPSAWYHIVVAIDTTQATASNRAKIYVNGVQVTAFGTATYPSQNTTLQVNSANPHVIGTRGTYSVDSNFDGYMAEVNFIDGQALTPSSFGETSTSTGVWIPKKYTGTYGTNGFYLPFTDNSALTTSSNVGLGKDFSGNSNYWTTNNISITAGTTYDSMTDVPTLTSATASNFATWSPLVLFPNTTYQASMTNANLLMTRSGGGQGGAVTTIGVTSGKFYAEMTVTAVGSSVTKLGVMATNNPPSISASSEYALGDTSASVAYRSNGARLTGGTTTNSWGDTYTTGDVIGVAFDADTGKVWFSKNGTFQASGDPAAGTNEAATLPTAVPFYFSAGGEGGISISLNCGQQPFAYTPPTGFVRLNTFNLPTPTIGATASTLAGKYMNVVTYTGTGSSQSITGLGFQPDWTWIKERNASADHGLYDAVRGVQLQLESNTTTAETTETTGLTAFGSDGFTVGALAQLNTSADTYVAWNWKANGAGSSNTDGTITSTVSANTTAGFSIVTYTGTGSNATVGHGLGVAPSMYIVKRRSNTGNWYVYHISIGNTNRLRLDETSASTAESAAWNNTSPTSTVFSIGTSVDVNASANTYVAYCFAQVAGYSAFGSYTGNGSTDGPFIFTGFRPRFFMTKCSSSTGDWHMTDTARYPTNSSTSMGYLDANTSAAEGNFNIYDGLSNGFKIRDNGSVVNASGATYIYMAFAESPFKYANAR